MNKNDSEDTHWSRRWMLSIGTFGPQDPNTSSSHKRLIGILVLMALGIFVGLFLQNKSVLVFALSLGFGAIAINNLHYLSLLDELAKQIQYKAAFYAYAFVALGLLVILVFEVGTFWPLFGVLAMGEMIRGFALSRIAKQFE